MLRLYWFVFLFYIFYTKCVNLDSEADELDDSNNDFHHMESRVGVGISANERQEKFLGAPSPLRGTASSEKIPITDEQISHVREQLRGIFDKKYSTLGHGTRAEAAEKILQEGLGTKVPDVISTAVPLFEAEKEYDEQDHETFRKLMDWPHYHLGAVVIVQIPNPSPDEQHYQGYHRWFNSVFQDTKVENSGYANRYVIPKEYIRGYWNAELGKFIPNPHFAPKKPVMEAPIPFNLSEKYAQSIRTPKEAIISPKAAQSTSEDIEDVW